MSNWNDKGVMNLVRQRLNDRLVVAGELVQGAAYYLCPWITGNLRSSITAEVKGDKVEIGTNVDYAAIVELGGKEKRNGRTRSAKPYLFPALVNSKSAIRKIMRL